MKTFAVQILSVVCLIPLVMGAPLASHRLSGDQGVEAREFEDPSAREFSVITKDTTRIPLGPDLDVVIDDYTIQTFPDDAILVLPSNAALESVGNPLMPGPSDFGLPSNGMLNPFGNSRMPGPSDFGLPSSAMLDPFGNLIVPPPRGMDC